MSKSNDPLWYVPDNYAAQDRLTFGVEIEIAIASLPADRADPDPDDPRACYGVDDGDFRLRSENARHHLTNTLIEAGVTAECVPGLEGDIFGYDPNWAPSPLAWAVKMDEDVDAPIGVSNAYQWHGIELNSPPLVYSEEAVREVMFVLELMRNTYRGALTRKTALHVHVGNGPRGFHPEIVQKLLSTWWTFEPQIEQIHPLFRIDNQATASLRRGSDLVQGVLVEKSKRNHRGWIEYILDESNCDLGKLERMSKHPISVKAGDDRSCVNIQPLFEAQLSGGTSKTIEFRQHTSTLDAQELAHWIRLVVGFTEFAENIDETILVPFLMEYIDKTPEQFGLEEALTKLGMPREGKYFGKVAADMEKLKAKVKGVKPKAMGALGWKEEPWILSGIWQNQ